MMCSQGRCVQCATDAQCRGGEGCAPMKCSASGTCDSMPKRSGERCATGVCDGSGRCVACLQNDDCPGEFGMCKNNRCEVAPGCGNTKVDPGEDCDSSAPGWDTSTCDSRCRALVYTTCSVAGAACGPPGWFCGPHGGCSKNCVGDSECSFPGYEGRCEVFDNLEAGSEDFQCCMLPCTSGCPSGTGSCVFWGYNICGQFSLPK